MKPVSVFAGLWYQAVGAGFPEQIPSETKIPNLSERRDRVSLLFYCR